MQGAFDVRLAGKYEAYRIDDTTGKSGNKTTITIDFGHHDMHLKLFDVNGQVVQECCGGDWKMVLTRRMPRTKASKKS